MERKVKKSSGKKLLNTSFCFQRCSSAKFFSVAMIDFIKYLLYSRGQVPSPFQNLERDFEIQEKKQIPKVPNKLLRHLSVFLAESTNIFRSILSVFEQGTPPEQIVVLFGSTPISPKEMFILEIETGCPCHSDETFINDIEKVQKTLSRQLLKFFVINGEIMQLTPCLPLTNTYILLSFSKYPTALEKDSSFLPKMQYVLPNRGNKHVIALSNCTKQTHDDEVNEDMVIDRMTSLVIDEKKTNYWFISHPLKGFQEKKCDQTTKWV